MSKSSLVWLILDKSQTFDDLISRSFVSDELQKVLGSFFLNLCPNCHYNLLVRPLRFSVRRASVAVF